MGEFLGVRISAVGYWPGPGGAQAPKLLGAAGVIRENAHQKNPRLRCAGDTHTIGW